MDRTAAAAVHPRVLLKRVALAAAALCLAGCTTSARPATIASPTLSATPTPTPIVLDTDRPGDPWRIRPHTPGHIEGYADRDSIAPGDALHLYVSTLARTFRVQVFRMGWYAGGNARLVETLGPYQGQKQAAATILEPRHTAVARWHASATLTTNTWLPGDYLLRLDGVDGSRSFVPLTVRGPTASGAVVLVSPDTTWQAYNLWGCCDLYDGDEGGNSDFAGRSRAVSFDRPYLLEYGAGEFIDRELPVVAEAERLHLVVDYVTDVDLQRIPHLLDGALAVVSMGHDEYWSPAMRNAVTVARNAGTNVAFLGANAVFRRIRLEPSPLGPDRVIVDYKSAAEDPLRHSDPAAVTSDWPDPPDSKPESALVGASYDCFVRRTNAGVVADATSFLLAGTGVRTGTVLPGLIGPEVDYVDLRDPTPRPLRILLHSPFRCAADKPSAADATYYTTRSGAGVFDSGTMNWVCAVGDGCRVTTATARFARIVTDNLLLAFAAGPAGRAHPAVDNVRTVLKP